ncbi:hypothetical protein [Bacteroides neonati]|uniref:hypothetical protein n=1 Tax=Bacteroides neonati TaxID=1347393 RepID=UPI0004AC885E|nr:hypothetical protein [Bacteroides neonati]
MGVFQEIWIDIKELGDKALMDLPSFESIGYTKIEIANCKGCVVISKDDLETLKHVYSIYSLMNKSLYHKMQSYSNNIPISESTFEDSALARAYYNGFTGGYRHMEDIISKAFLRSGNQLELKGCVIETRKYIKRKVMRYKLRKDNVAISTAHLIDMFRWFGISQGAQIKCIEHGIELGEIRYEYDNTVNAGKKSDREHPHLILIDNNPTLSITLLEEFGNTDSYSLDAFETMLLIENREIRRTIFNRIRTIAKDGMAGEDLCSLMSALHRKGYISLSNKKATLESFQSSFPKSTCSSSYFSRKLPEEVKGVKLKNTEFYLKFLEMK